MDLRERLDNIHEEKKKPRKRKKKKKPPIKKPRRTNTIIVLPNLEKDKIPKESWAKPKNRSLGCIPHPFRLLATGGIGRGKSNSLKNIFLEHQRSTRPFKEVHVVTVSTSNIEYNDIEPTSVMSKIPDMELFDEKLKTLLIFDDFELCGLSKADKAKLSTLFRYVSSHRNVSIMMGYQSFFDVPTICRKTSTCFLVYVPLNSLELSTTANRVGLEAAEMRYIYKHICNGTYDSLFIDHTVGTPARLRKNIYQPIEMDNDSESDTDV